MEFYKINSIIHLNFLAIFEDLVALDSNIRSTLIISYSQVEFKFFPIYFYFTSAASNSYRLIYLHRFQNRGCNYRFGIEMDAVCEG